MLKNPSDGWQKTEYSLPDESGHFGKYGGRFVSETLMGPLLILKKLIMRLYKMMTLLSAVIWLISSVGPRLYILLKD